MAATVTMFGADAARGFSKAVQVGPLLFVAGQVARDEQGRLIGVGDARAQTQQVLRNVRAALEAGGSGLDRVSKITIYGTRLEDYPAISEVRSQVFGAAGHYPASTFVVVASLVHPDYLVEIEAVALAPESPPPAR